MANLAPPLKFTAWDSSGNPLAGGKLYTYVAGTTTPKATYTDSGLGTPNANPVILNSRGEASVWLSGAYQLVLKDASDVTIYSQDNVTDALANSTISGTLTISSTAVTWSGNPTHSGNHTFSGNVSTQGNTTIGNATTDSLTVNPAAVTWATNVNHSGNHGFGVTPSSGALVEVSGGLQIRGTEKISFSNTLNQTYIYASASNVLVLGTNTTNRFTIGSAGNVDIAAPSSGTTATLTIGALNGAAPLKIGTVTVANLPAAATAGAGSKAFVTDANATTFASIVAAGGANGVPVYCDGTNWRIG